MPYILALALPQALVAGVWVHLLRGGLLGGYFTALPAVPLFFTLLPLLAHRYQLGLGSSHPQKGMRGLLGLILLRLLATLLFALVGLLSLPPAHRLAFMATTASAYLIAFLFTTLTTARG
ncbi:MAG: hypothetical protein CSA07_00855 [Bacteroidia bacterium]|nr:MAG: hypothetical protein CSA07_00855 [Bacteroidia bacterium]